MFLKRPSWKSYPCYFLMRIKLWPQQEVVMCCGNVPCHCFHPELASCGDIWQEVKKICPATFLISEGKNNYLWSWLTPCGSVNYVGLTNLSKCKMFELYLLLFPSYSYIFPALFRHEILTAEIEILSLPLSGLLSFLVLLLQSFKGLKVSRL